MSRCTRHGLARGPDGLCAMCLADTRRLGTKGRDPARKAARVFLTVLAFVATFAALMSVCDTK